MFTLPNPKEILESANILKQSNEIFTYLLNSQKQQYTNFWMPNGQLRSKEEINKILEAMDSVEPGQSLKFFDVAYKLSQCLLSLDPACLAPEEYAPKYEYEIQNGNIRVI
jgi:hypothetical protein